MASPVGLLIACAVIVGLVGGLPSVAGGLLVLACLRLLGLHVPPARIGMIVLFFLLGAMRHPVITAQPGGGELTDAERAIGVVDSMPVARSGGERAVLRIREIGIDGTWIPADARVLAYVSTNSLAVGDRVEVIWTFTPVTAMPPGIGGFVRSQDAVGTAQIWWFEVIAPGRSPRRYLVDLRRSISDRLQELVPGDAGALLAGIVTGDDSGLSPTAREAFLATGTSHITAVSGSNVAMLLALWQRAFRRRARRRHLLLQAAIIVSIWLYCAMTGLEPSALRAVTVATFIVLGGRFGRRADPFTVLLLAAAGLLLWQPEMIWSIGFWLSVVASGALIGNFANVASHSWRDDLRATLLGLIAVQFATLPLIVWTFGTWPPIGMLANVLLAPVMTIAFPLAFVFAGVAFLPLVGPGLSFVPALLSDSALSIVERLAPVLPPVSIEPIGPAGVVLVALPCLAIVLGLNVDVRRWLPRWRAMAVARPGITLASASGLLVGLICAVVIVTGMLA